MVSKTMKKCVLLCAALFALAACDKPFVLELLGDFCRHSDLDM
jgi:hypothetical protein